MRRRSLWLIVAVITVLGASGIGLRILLPRVAPGIEWFPPVELHLAPDPLIVTPVLTITNTMLSALLASALLVATLVFTRIRPDSRLSVGLFALFDVTLKFAQQTAGERLGRRLFPVAVTLFLFIAVNSWLALLPVYGPLTWQSESGSVPLLRGAGTDINLPLALALVSFVAVQASGLAVLKTAYLSRFAQVGGLLRGQWVLGLVGLFTGLMHAMNEVARLLSFTFRLFGTMTAGEVLIIVSSFLAPLAFVLPFFGLELLFGVIQAAVFAGLTIVFAALAAQPEHSPTERSQSGGGA